MANLSTQFGALSFTKQVLTPLHIHELPMNTMLLLSDQQQLRPARTTDTALFHAWSALQTHGLWPLYRKGWSDISLTWPPDDCLGGRKISRRADEWGAAKTSIKAVFQLSNRLDNTLSSILILPDLYIPIYINLHEPFIQTYTAKYDMHFSLVFCFGLLQSAVGFPHLSSYGDRVLADHHQPGRTHGSTNSTLKPNHFTWSPPGEQDGTAVSLQPKIRLLKHRQFVLHVPCSTHWQIMDFSPTTVAISPAILLSRLSKTL